MTNIYSELNRVLVKTEEDSAAWTPDALDKVKGTQFLMFLNAHGVNLARDNDGFRRALLNSDFLLRDGVGLGLAFRFLKMAKTENLNGTDLIPKVLARHKNQKIAVWGSSQEALEKLGVKLRDQGYENIVSLLHGFSEDAFYVDAFQTVKPDIVILCMGMPRQELLSQKLSLPGHDCLIISAGGWANFHSGHIKRAHVIVRTLRLEWLYRLMLEPRRLGRRYTIDTAAYFLTVFKIFRNRAKMPKPPT